MYKDFITCALSVDIGIDGGDQSISFSDPSQCDLYYASKFQSCYGGFWALYSAWDPTPDSPPAALAGGLSKKGDVYAYYSLPAQDSYNAKGVYPVYKLNCKVCTTFFKRLLECALPFNGNEKSLTEALLDCAGVTRDINDNYTFTKADDYFLATSCGLINGQYSFAPSELDAPGRVSYAFLTPVFSSPISQYCNTMEARAKPNGGGVTVNVLKNNVVFNN